jgi:hypothetical protein
MGKKGRGQRSEQRKQARKAAHSAQKALYASYATQGKLKGSRRQKAKAKAMKPSKHAHLCANCGNPGCDKCFDKIVTRMDGTPLPKAPRYTTDTARNPKRKAKKA